MAAMLLLGTNAWADASVSTWADLKTELQKGGTVTLTADINATDLAAADCIWIGSETETGDAPAAVLDLNGHNITIKPAVNAINPFVLTKGSLKVTSSSPATITVTKGNKVIKKGTNVFFVFGASDAIKQDPKTNPFSHLEIDVNVTVQTQNGTVIAVDALTTSHAAIKSLSKKPTYGSNGFAYGACIDVKGKLFSQGAEPVSAGNDEQKCYGVKVNGNLSVVPADADKPYAPYVHIHPSAVITTDYTINKSAAAYASGYAQWLIEGTCSGATGVYAGKGVIVLKDASVKSGAATYTAPTADGGANGAGSGVVVNSRGGAYEGEVTVTVTGDSKVESTSGYALEEIVNTKDGETNVESITISGGTFVGNQDKGAIIITETTATKSDTTITIAGGNVTGKTGVIGTDSLATYLNNQGGTHATLVTDEKGNTTLVISGGDAPTGVATLVSNADLSAKWTGTAQDIENTFALKELEINEKDVNGDPIEQILTIKSNATFTVERVILGAGAKIIVEAGGTFIVTGNQGIVAPVADNIVLNTSETAPATFLFDPAVQSNRHPNATVKLLAKEIGYETFSATKYWYWNRFALPIKKATTWSKTPNVTSYIYKWSYEDDDWKSISALTDMVPFQGYILTANQDVLGDVEYTFTGELAGGNETAALQFARNGFHFFGNSYTGYVSVDKMVEQIMGASDIDGTVWVWGNDQNYHAIPLMALRNNPAAFPYDWQKEIAPMQTFVLKHNVNATGSTELNYATAVWGNPRYNSFNGNAAPRRHVADETTHMNIVITAENGKSDYVMFMEDGLCSDAYDNGYDGTKYMNEEALNMYASVNGANYSVVATDNIEGKMLTINTVNDVNYTMTFANVNGEEYAIRDNVTGAVIAIEEGASYEFAAQPNSVAEGRFEIVKVSKVATDIENTEVKANAKGIYTIMGQYVGEDFEALPAGIYVVDGVKIVK